LDDDDFMKRMMISHKIELILPLIQDANVIGFLCMGDHKNSGYTNRDIRALNTISNELIIAIQNAAAVHEIREINATLQQRITNATKELRSKNAILTQLDKVKDEFISMASHQLRTPLTSVKGYLSMVIEGDAGKITPSQKQLLDQAFMSSENMVHLINDFLNVSRIQSGKFVIDKTEVDLSRLVEEEVSGLRPNAAARNMKLVYRKPRKFPLLNIDEGKIRQVVMNFSDNAIYYSHEHSSIVISLGVEGNEVVFTVKDTGIGVPKTEQSKLFAKFYRADNAKVQRPDGTGVGIYLAKKVIDASGGKIIFESTEGKGSTFGFRLPIK
jgi:signal transduction histidine kinase